ncbi:MAG: glycosyltransferase family 1 protein [Myxococcales bacterium]|nr:glycosyltransferase family 1 protein [Myxococcales bacterium]
MTDSTAKTEQPSASPKYALFASIPLIGHINPLIPQAEELVRRGWRVALASTREVRAHIERQARGVEFVDLGPMGPLAEQLQRTEVEGALDPSYTRGTARMTANFVELWPIMYDALSEAIRARRPDVVVANIMTFAGMDVADREQIPLVINNPYLLAVLPAPVLPPADDLPFYLSAKSVHDITLVDRIKNRLLRMAASRALNLTLGKRLNALRITRGRLPVDLYTVLKDQLIITNSCFGLEYSRPLPPLVHALGPMIPDPEPLPVEYKEWFESGPPVVYANLGTLALASRDVILRMLAAFDSSAFRVLWVLKRELQEALAGHKIPDHVRIESWVPSVSAVLSHENVRVFISHCGVNSVYESLAAGTPIVGIPMMAGQREMAVRVKDAGVGLYVNKSTFTPAELRQTVLRVLEEDRFRRPIPALQSSFKLAGGARRAADLIEHFVAHGIAHYTRAWRPHGV